MIRLIGVLLIFGGSGVFAVQSLRQREIQLKTAEELLYALHRLEREIRCEGRTLIRIFSSLAAETSGQTQRFFAALLRCRQDDPEGSLLRQWEICADNLTLPKEGQRIWRALGRRLEGDEESIEKGITLVSEELSEVILSLRNNLPEERRVKAALCLSAAAFLSVLLI